MAPSRAPGAISVIKEPLLGLRSIVIKPTDLTREQLLLIYNNTSDLVFLIEVAAAGRYRVAAVNRAYLQRTQLEHGDIVGRSIDDVLKPEQHEYVKSRYDQAVAHGGPWSYETRTTLRGETIYLDTTLVPVFDEDEGRCTQLIGVSRDITQSKMEQKALKREKQRAENYLDIAEAVIVALDRQGRISMLNRKGYSMLGYPEGSLTGRNWCELVIAPDKQDRFMDGFRRCIEAGVVDKNVNYVHTRTGDRILISWANAIIRGDEGEILGVLSSGEDITDRRRAEQAMIAGQRVLAADEVVAAVAHDFNNSLQGILGNIEIARTMADRPEALGRHLETASKLADDAARRLKVLRGGHDGRAAGEPLDLHEVIEDVIVQTQPLWKDEAQRLGHDIRIERQFSRHVRPSVGSPGELRTVLYNVIKNSIEALPAGGKIRIRTGFNKGTNVIAVSDDGIGMDSETSTRIFQPFFSTKGLESGRGLGMSASHGIVRAHGGEIRVKQSAPGLGTTIELRLCAVHSGSEPAEARPADARSRQHTILWVDDDPEIASLARSYIASLGHLGDVATGGDEALALARRNAYSVVITDVGMPGMNGLDLARCIHRDIDPRLPIIVLTGWGDSVADTGQLPASVVHVISKPIRLDAVREMLNDLPSSC